MPSAATCKKPCVSSKAQPCTETCIEISGTGTDIKCSSGTKTCGNGRPGIGISGTSRMEISRIRTSGIEISGMGASCGIGAGVTGTAGLKCSSVVGGRSGSDANSHLQSSAEVDLSSPEFALKPGTYHVHVRVQSLQ